MAGTRKSFLDELIENNRLSEFVQMVSDGATYAELSKHYNTSSVTIWKTIKKIKETKQSKEVEQPKEEKPQSAYQILYANRKRVVELKKQGYYNVDIAKIFGVEDKDVFDFFDKRVKLTPTQYRDIKIAYNRGKSVEALAQQYGVAVETVERIVKKVIASEDYSPEVKQETLDDVDCIPKFWQFIHNLETKIDMATKEVNRCNDTIRDIMHKIEIEDYDEKEILEELKKVKQYKQERRESKDFLELVEPFVEFLKDEDNAKMVKTLANIAGRINNKAKQMNNRIYFIRAAEEE